MGTHGVAGASPRAAKPSQHAKEPAAFRSRGPRALSLRDWPVSWRLIAVIVVALVMGLVFGGLRVAPAPDSAGQFGRVAQLPVLGPPLPGLVQPLPADLVDATGLFPAPS